MPTLQINYMSNYRRVYIPGGMYFLTIITYQRQPLFSDRNNISLLRNTTAKVKSEMPFDIIGAVILPEHIHFIWSLPKGDRNYSKRVGRLKVLFTKSLRGDNNLPQNVSLSRQKHRESNVWQRRFWEHTIRDERDLAAHLDYIHYNPVKHGYVSCPHLWEYSSFHSWVKKGGYPLEWACNCNENKNKIPNFDRMKNTIGE